jgi:hypothetical protein
MAAIGTIQIVGNKNASPTEVELNTLALRSVARPVDTRVFGTLRGVYSACNDGRLWANASTSPPSIPQSLFNAFIPQGFSCYASIRKLIYSVSLITAGTGAAGLYEFDLFHFATVSAGAQPNSLVGPQLNKLTGTEENSNLNLVAHSNPSSGQNAGATTPTPNAIAIDNQELANLFGPMAAGTVMTSSLIDARPGEHPLILGPADCVTLRVTQLPTWTTATTHLDAWTIVWEEYEGFQ